MHMSFWWSYNVTNYLFDGLSVRSEWGLFTICLSIGIMSFSFEFMKYLQARQRQKELKLRSLQLKTICPTDTSTLLPRGDSDRTNILNITRFDRALLCGADFGLWFLLQNVGYILMVSVMLYNGWFFVSAVLGGGFGHFIFGQRFMKINLQNCHIIRNTFCMQKCGEPESVAASRDGESTPALEVAGTSGASHCHEVTVNVHVDCDRRN